MEEEERQRQAEEERERREQHLLQEHLKQVLPAWNAPPVAAPEPVNAPSLADIQRAQEEKERVVSMDFRWCNIRSGKVYFA